MGAAFGKIVSSLVTDIMMPLIGLLFPSKPDFTNLMWNNIKYGNFIQIIIDFLITAVAIFIFVKAINTAKEKMAKEEAAEEKAPEVDSKEELLKEIRDLLKEGK